LDRVGIERYRSLYLLLSPLDHTHIAVGLAEVVGSNPTRSTFINQGNYGTEFSLDLGDCRTNPAASEHGIKNSDAQAAPRHADKL
jgi:hypothetical protein